MSGLEPLNQSLQRIADTGNLALIDTAAELGEQQILKMYPEDSWRPDFPLNRFLSQQEWRRMVRAQRSRAMAVLAAHPVDLLAEQARLDVQQLTWDHATRNSNRQQADLAERLARIGQGQGNKSALDITREFLAEIEKVEGDTTLTKEQQHRRTQMLQEGLSSQLRAK